MTTKPDWVVRLQRWPIGVVGEFLGTRIDPDPQSRAARRWIRRLLMTQAEQLALTTILVEKGIIEPAAYEAALQRSAQTLCRELEVQFPGFTSSEIGINIDIVKARATTKDWPK